MENYDKGWTQMQLLMEREAGLEKQKQALFKAKYKIQGAWNQRGPKTQKTK